MQIQRTIPLIIQEDQDLLSLVDTYNRYQKAISAIAFNDGSPLRPIDLHHAAYHQVHTALGSQMRCTAIRTVAAAYASAKSNKKPAKKPFQFNKKSALFQWQKDFSFQKGLLSISTSCGRKKLEFRIPEAFQQDFAVAVSYDSITVTADNKVHLCLTLEVQEPQGLTVVGIDLGINNPLVASKSEGEVLLVSGTKLNIANKKTRKLRKRLTKKLTVRKAEHKRTRSVTRLLKRLGRKQHNRTKTFTRETASKLCAWAPPNAVLVFEDLTGFRDSLAKKPGPKRKRKGTIRKQNEWFFNAMLAACKNKAERVGLAIDFTEPAYTSQKCRKCGFLGKRFGKSFTCVCGHAEHADVNAAHNIRLNYAALRDCGLLSVSPEALPLNKG